MRFAVALVALVAAAVLILAGVAQRTFLKPPDRIEIATSVPADVGYVVVPASVLRAHPGQQSLHLRGEGTAFAAYGRAADVTGWLAGERYAQLRVDAEGRMLPPVVKTAPAVAGFSGSGSTDPDGSDTWMDQQRGERRLDWTVNVPSSVAVLVASDGSGPAPSSIRLDWPVRTGTPFALPLIIGGGALAVVGLLLYVWALVQLRRRMGPRRKPPAKMPRSPRPPKYRPLKPVASGPGRGRRSGARSTVHRVLPALAVVLAAGLTAGVATPVESAAAAENAPDAAVTEEQAKRIVQRAAETAAEADADRDADLAATRFAGPALALRAAAYRIRAKDKKADLPQAIPVEDAVMQLTLPEATAAWPRTLFAVVAVGSDETVPPLALALIQDDPRADYKVHYAMPLQPGATLPDLPSALLGAKRLDPGNTVLRVPPAQLGTDYGALLRDEDADEASLFAADQDLLIAKVGEAARKKAAKRLGSTAGIAYKDLEGDAASIVALSTADSGALVSVYLEERMTVKPKRSGVTVQPSGGVKVLAKTSSTAEGISSVYGYQLLFEVPSAGSADPVVLLGYDQGLVSAKEL